MKNVSIRLEYKTCQQDSTYGSGHGNMVARLIHSLTPLPRGRATGSGGELVHLNIVLDLDCASLRCDMSGGCGRKGAQAAC